MRKIPILALLTSLSLGTLSAVEVLTDFDEKNDGGLEWRVVNDGVMGGLSKGSVSITDAGMLSFKGTLSLENNGGFSSIRTNRIDLDLAAAKGVAMRVRGDGRTYQVRLSTDARYRGMEMSFMAEFPTKKGKWSEVRIPFSEFKGTWRGRSLPDAKFDPSKVSRLGILLADKKPGGFALEVDRIRTFGKGETSVAANERKGESTSNPEKGTLAAIASSDARFSTLLAAVKAAGLGDALAGADKLTVFAPTNDAFAKLPKGTVEKLLKPENKGRLQQILKFHVLAGEVSLADALKAGSGKTLQGGSVSVAFKEGQVFVNKARLQTADIKASNGMIHVIDAVLLPAEKKKEQPKNIAGFLKQWDAFKTLLAAVDAAGLTDALTGKQALTVFAPTNEAFKKLPKGTVESLLKPENKDKLKAVLLNHVVNGRVGAGDALNAKTATTLSGGKLKVYVSDGILKVNGATLQKVDLEAGNGVIHVIDQVLVPSDGVKSTDRDSEKSDIPDDEGDSVVSIAEAAIDRGVPLFNSGKPEVCADAYARAIRRISNSAQLEDEAQEKLKMVVERGEGMRDPSARAWLYRHTLDRVLNVFSGRVAPQLATKNARDRQCWTTTRIVFF